MNRRKYNFTEEILEKAIRQGSPIWKYFREQLLNDNTLTPRVFEFTDPPKIKKEEFTFSQSLTTLRLGPYVWVGDNGYADIWFNINTRNYVRKPHNRNLVEIFHQNF